MTLSNGAGAPDHDRGAGRGRPHVRPRVRAAGHAYPRQRSPGPPDDHVQCHVPACHGGACTPPPQAVHMKSSFDCQSFFFFFLCVWYFAYPTIICALLICMDRDVLAPFWIALFIAYSFLSTTCPIIIRWFLVHIA